ncbi:unnamed protein product [Trichobilharzia szidati]|nr:unnamed protein product [Trichobilharzia szidati]
MLDLDLYWSIVDNMDITGYSDTHTSMHGFDKMEVIGTQMGMVSTMDSNGISSNAGSCDSSGKILSVKQETNKTYHLMSTDIASKQDVQSIVVKSNEEQCNLIKVRVGFDITRKGERSLVIDGYKFTKSRDGMGDRVFWRCSRRECKATAVTVSNKVEHVRSIHCHSPPVAAEFFSEDSSRFEQEVRFNNVVYTQRSRIRRRSQPNPSTKVSKQLVMKQFCLDKKKASTGSTTCSVTSEIPCETYSSDFLNVDCSNNILSPAKKRHRSDQVTSDYITLQTMSALLNKWADSKQMANTNNDDIEGNLSNNSNSLLSTTNMLITDPSDENDNNSLNSIPVTSINGYLSSFHEDSFPNSDDQPSSGSATLEQLAALATSLNNISNHILEKGSKMMNEVNSSPNNDETTMKFTNKASIQSTKNNDLPKTNKYDIEQSATSSYTVDINPTRHHPHEQIVLLSNDRLNDLLKIVSCGTMMNNDISIKSGPINTSAFQGSPTISNGLLKSTGYSKLSDAHCTNSLSKCTATHCCSYYPRANITMENPNNVYTPPSLQYTSCCSTNGISSQIVHFSVNSSSTALSNKQPVTMDNDEYSSIRDVNNNNINNANGNKLSSSNLIVHWKKEKIRESVEECGVPSINSRFYDENVTIPQNVYLDKHTSDTAQLSTPWNIDQFPTNNNSISKCSPENIPDTINGKSVNYSPQNTSTSLSSTNGTLNKAQSKDSITAYSNCLPMSNSDQNDDQFLYNQIQDDILIKILNKIQQLTAKLDADANPPEVIQNCRAIQACLDTINAIKRVKSNRSDDECSRSEVSLASYNSHFTHHLNSLSTNYSIQQHNGFSSSSLSPPPPPQQQQPSVIQPL